MPLRRYAKLLTPFGLIKEIEGRLSLLIPDKVVKEQDFYENYQQSSARFTLVWWLSEEAEYHPEEALRKVVKQVLQERDDIEVDITDPIRSIDTGKMMITLSLVPEKKEGRVAEGPVKALLAPLNLSIGGNDYLVLSWDMGTTWEVSRSGQTVEKDQPSIAAAVGKLIKHLIIDLGNIEELDSGTSKIDDIEKDFVASFAAWFANSPLLTKDSLKSLTSLVELLTNKDFVAE